VTEPLNLPLIPVADLTAERLRLAAGIRAPRTLAGYASDWKSFTAWCSRAEQVALPAAVKAAAQSIGLDPAGFAGHSLRAGFVTEAGERGAGELLIAAQTGHRSMSVLRLYFRRRNLFKANACAMLGL